MSYTSTRERPGAVGLAARDALDLPLIGAEGERIDDVAAHSALVVAEGRHGLDPADQPALGALPHEGHAVAELRQGELERLHCRDPVASVETRFEFAEAKLLALRGHSHVRSVLSGLERKRGGRE